MASEITLAVSPASGVALSNASGTATVGVTIDGAMSAIPATDRFGFGCWLHSASGGQANDAVMAFGTGGGDSILLYPFDGGSANGPRVYWQGGGFVAGAGTALAAGREHLLYVAAYSVTDRQIFINGVQRGTWSGGLATATPGAFRLMAWAGSGSQCFKGTAHDFMVHRVPPSPSAIWQMYANPWDLYHVPGRRVFFDLAAPPATGRGSRLALMGVS
mgnify:CR=1 FL=1